MCNYLLNYNILVMHLSMSYQLQENENDKCLCNDVEKKNIFSFMQNIIPANFLLTVSNKCKNAKIFLVEYKVSRYQIHGLTCKWTNELESQIPNLMHSWIL